jgi:flavin reductase (DIM6/NTAB) family NADH-FMN oxidoreductase RutF
MGQFATGVTVITTQDLSGRPFGTTANAVSSVSLRPPLVLACLRHESETLTALLQCRRFAINILRSSQAELADRFSLRAADDTWDAVAHRSANGVPLLEGTIATLECELHDIADAGDHTVVVGHVVDLEHASPNSDPLLFYAGSYRLPPRHWRRPGGMRMRANRNHNRRSRAIRRRHRGARPHGPGSGPASRAADLRPGRRAAGGPGRRADRRADRSAGRRTGGCAPGAAWVITRCPGGPACSTTRSSLVVLESGASGSRINSAAMATFRQC